MLEIFFIYKVRNYTKYCNLGIRTEDLENISLNNIFVDVLGFFFKLMANSLWLKELCAICNMLLVMEIHSDFMSFSICETLGDFLVWCSLQSHEGNCPISFPHIFKSKVGRHTPSPTCHKELKLNNQPLCEFTLINV